MSHVPTTSEMRFRHIVTGALCCLMAVPAFAMTRCSIDQIAEDRRHYAAEIEARDYQGLALAAARRPTIAAEARAAMADGRITNAELARINGHDRSVYDTIYDPELIDGDLSAIRSKARLIQVVNG